MSTDGAGMRAKPKVGFHILRHYLKDLSFENPRGPDRTAQEDRSGLALAVDSAIRTSRASTDDAPPADIVELQVTVTARRDSQVAFLCEIAYVAEVRLENIPGLVRPQILSVDVPRFLAPRIEAVMGNAALAGGYPKLHLGEQDFLSDFNRQAGDAWKAERRRAAGGTQ